MIERFQGADNRRRLLEALDRQPVVRNNPDIAGELANAATLHEFKPGETFIHQGGEDDDLYLILAGSVSIEVAGRRVATRTEGMHVGEMALTSPAARRAASVVAIDTCVVAKVTEQAFQSIAERNAQMWRVIAGELAGRLRERNGLVRPRNDRSVLFIGSSHEALEVARCIQDHLSHDPVTVRPWTTNVFKGSTVTIEALEKLAEESDFAVLVLTPDDIVDAGKGDEPAMRDNVLFELGLFMGKLGRGRTFMVIPRGSNLRIPTDLVGVTALGYDGKVSAKDLDTALASACNEIRRTVKELGPR